MRVPTFVHSPSTEDFSVVFPIGTCFSIQVIMEVIEASRFMVEMSNNGEVISVKPVEATMRRGTVHITEAYFPFPQHVGVVTKQLQCLWEEGVVLGQALSRCILNNPMLQSQVEFVPPRCTFHIWGPRSGSLE